jgi:hypothetical protein
MSIQAKEELYYDRNLINTFITLAIRVAPTMNYFILLLMC